MDGGGGENSCIVNIEINTSSRSIVNLQRYLICIRYPASGAYSGGGLWGLSPPWTSEIYWFQGFSGPNGCWALPPPGKINKVKPLCTISWIRPCPTCVIVHWSSNLYRGKSIGILWESSSSPFYILSFSNIYIYQNSVLCRQYIEFNIIP